MKRASSGFTLIELVAVMVIVSVLAAVAAPRFLALGTSARIASLKATAGAVSTAASLANTQCRMSQSCMNSVYMQGFVQGPGGEYNGMYFGYPTGLSRPNEFFGIKDWVQVQGYTIVESFSVTEFRQDGAPDPSQCKVTYTELAPLITTVISGC